MNVAQAGAPAETPTVSVVVPTYERAGTIRRAVESVLAQTYRDHEILVIDDGSTDDSRIVLRPYREQGLIRFLWQPHRNAASARNRGIRASRGRYIAFLDSDDEWLPEKLAKQVAVLGVLAETTGVVYCDMLRVSPSGRAHRFPAPTVRRGEVLNSRTQDYQVRGIGIQSTLFRRQCFDEGRLFDENLFAFCDLELLTRMSRAFDFHHLSEPLVKYHAGPGISTNLAAVADAREYMLRKHPDSFVQRPRALAYQYAKIAAARFLAGDTRGARPYARRALQLDPVNPRVIIRALPGLVGPRASAAACRRVLTKLPPSWEAR